MTAIFVTLRRLLPAVGILALVLWVYWPAHHAGFIWLDESDLRDIAWLREANLMPLLRGFNDWNNYFRPAGVALLALEERLFGIDPAAMHWVSLSLHLVNTLLVGLLAIRFTGDGSGMLTPAKATALAMLVYGLHPALIEPVVYLSAQFDLDVTFFILVGLLCNDSLRRTGTRAAMVATCFFLAACCKESAIAFPVLILLQDWLRERRSVIAPQQPVPVRIWQRQRGVYVSVLAAGIAYLALRYWGMGHLLQLSSGPVLSLPARLQTAGSLLLIYWRILLWPMVDQGPLHEIDVASLASFDLVACLHDVAIVALLCIGLLLLRRFRMAGALLLAPTVALLPVLHIIPIDFDSSPYHERYTITALALAASLLPATLADLRLPLGRARTATIVVSTLMLLWIGASALNIRITLPLWSDETKLWLWASQTHPESVLARNHLLAAYLAKDDRAHARPIAAQLLNERLACPVCMLNVTRLALIDGNVAMAKAALDRVRRVMPRMQQARLQELFVLFDGDVHDAQGEAEQAEADYRRAIELEPLDPETHMRLALLLARQGRIEPAGAEAQRAFELFAPDQRDAQAKLFQRALAEPNLPVSPREPFP